VQIESKVDVSLKFHGSVENSVLLCFSTGKVPLGQQNQLRAEFGEFFGRMLKVPRKRLFIDSPICSNILCTFRLFIEIQGNHGKLVIGDAHEDFLP